VEIGSTDCPDWGALKRLLLEISGQRSLQPVLDRIVQGLAELPDVALARIWLLRPGDICPSCPLRESCPGEVDCLHLVSSAGSSRVGPSEWSRTSGDFRRFPVGFGKVGGMASTKTGLSKQVSAASSWLVRPEWAAAEGIEGFAGRPLLYDGELLGVLGMFSRFELDPEGLSWLRMLADHAASAVANARAFEEIERLKRSLELERDYLREESREAQAYGEIVGTSGCMRSIQEQIELVAPTDASVLILGESGTGKELVARALHDRSRRSAKPLVRVNCASIPKDLFESEFFGHVRGAFTGAVRDREGRFALAEGGTLFLDEVGEIPLELQSKLLRVLQEGEYERIGAARTRKVDVRVIAATNRDLRQEAEQGSFREDLFYRLNVFPLEVAPLRARPDDIPALSEHFLARSAQRLRLPRPRLTEAALAKLVAYRWPGNVRELQNVIERAVIVSRGGDLIVSLPGAAAPSAPPPSEAPGGFPTLQALEGRRIRAALERSGWVIDGERGAGRLLGLHPNTLRSRMKKHGIKRPDA